MLVLYTDGATESGSPDGVEFGRDRLAQAVKENYDRSARELIASLEMAVLEWTRMSALTTMSLSSSSKRLRNEFHAKAQRSKVELN